MFALLVTCYVVGMEFTYRVSEEEYLRAHKVARGMQLRPSTGKTILFWVFVVVCLVLLFSVIQKSASSHSEETMQARAQAPEVPTSVMVHNILVNIGPLALVPCLWVGLWLFWIPYKVRRQYRRDPNYHGEMTITLDADMVDVRSTTGFLWRNGWNAVDRWREKEGFLLLQMKSRGFLFVNVRNLSEPMREKMRSILAAALPGK